jgi:hypothetical protein
MDYYINKHMEIVDRHWRPFGMKSWSVLEFPAGDESKIYVQAIMLWDSVEAFEKAIEANIPEVSAMLVLVLTWRLIIFGCRQVMEDIKHYSDVMPVRYYGKIVSKSPEGL